MRALKPWVGPLLAVLLLLQWGGAAASCLGMMAWSPDQVICHAPPDGAGAQSSVPGAPGQPDTMAACAACAPLPASLLPVLPELPPPAPPVTLLGALPPAVTEAQAQPVLRPQQPRAPPRS